MVDIGQNGCIRVKWCFSGKVVVFGKVVIFLQKFLYSGKVVLFGQK